tara:strand:+ start:384 stop:560 length:177 start_codon:yes stop_codon:yes gene_type:complete
VNKIQQLGFDPGSKDFMTFQKLIWKSRPGRFLSQKNQKLKKPNVRSWAGSSAWKLFGQ